MKQRVPVSKIMTHNVMTLNLNQSLHDADSMFKELNIRHIPVMSGDKLVGLLSLTDLMRISFIDLVSEDTKSLDKSIYNMLSIEQVMTKDVVTVDENTMIKDVAHILSEKEFHALPVLKNEKLVGIVTTTDLIRHLLDLY